MFPLFEPSEDLLTTFNGRLEEVEIFLGREFEHEPRLVVVPPNVDARYAGKYIPKGHEVAYNPHGSHTSRHEVNEERLEESDLDTINVKNGLESMQSQTEDDILWEELFHAKQAEELGYSEPDFSLKNLKPEDFSTDPLSENVAVYLVEGFADFCRSYLSNNWTSQDTENILGFVREARRLPGVSESYLESTMTTLDEAVQKYVGHLFFRSFNNAHPLDDTFNIAFTNPRDYDDLPEVFQQVERGNTDYEKELWEFARNYMEDNYL